MTASAIRTPESDLASAIDAFHSALDTYPGHRIGHGRNPGWVDDHDEAIVEALLRAGWMPPRAGTDATRSNFREAR